VGPALSGYTVAVAADRPTPPVAALLVTAGAEVSTVQVTRAVPALDGNVRAAIRRCLAGPVDDIVLTSAFGVRTWWRMAERFGCTGAMVVRFAGARLWAGSQAAGDALRDLGYEAWSPTESPDELVNLLLDEPAWSRRIVLQSDGGVAEELGVLLGNRGADVIAPRTQRYAALVRPDATRRLIDLVTTRQVDALVVTGAAAAKHLIDQAVLDGTAHDLVAVLGGGVPTLCFGEHSAAVLRAYGVPVTTALVPCAAEVVRVLGEILPALTVRCAVQGYQLEIRARVVMINDEVVPMQRGPLAVLRALAVQPGRVLSRNELRRLDPDWTRATDDAIGAAVYRLRRTLPDEALVGTVLKRGYRLVP
jgi:uroporphyrinogen-III synthase